MNMQKLEEGGLGLLNEVNPHVVPNVLIFRNCNTSNHSLSVPSIHSLEVIPKPSVSLSRNSNHQTDQLHYQSYP